eukprot:scaffold3598_cov148-Skeletonema_dohrnii-CCMP3373.AAC.12
MLLFIFTHSRPAIIHLRIEFHRRKGRTATEAKDAPCCAESFLPAFSRLTTQSPLTRRAPISPQPRPELSSMTNDRCAACAAV